MENTAKCESSWNINRGTRRKLARTNVVLNPISHMTEAVVLFD